MGAPVLPCILQIATLALPAIGLAQPLRSWLPVTAATLALRLGSQGQHCRLECGALASRAGACSAAGALGSVGSCPAAGPTAHHYGAAVGWARDSSLVGDLAPWLRLPDALLKPPLRWLPTAWVSRRGSCVAQCFALHGWLQVGGGALGAAGCLD